MDNDCADFLYLHVYCKLLPFLTPLSCVCVNSKLVVRLFGMRKSIQAHTK
jgi:hypothetical protein